MKVLVRADASATLGSGHVVRCLTLADALRAQGAETVFVCRRSEGDLCDHIASAGYAVRATLDGPVLDWREDADRTIEVAQREAPVHQLIVDHYALDFQWESLLRPHVGRIMVIDDLADRAHDCDLLLDQNYYSDPLERYDGLVPDDCVKLLGPHFAMLRPQFMAARPAQPRDSAVVKRVLVFLTASDPGNATQRVLLALDAVSTGGLEVDIAIGAGSRSIAALQSYCAAHAGRHLHVQTSNMAELLLRADLAIGGAGASSWERACLGVPTLAIGLAANQLPIGEALARHGALLYVGRLEDLDDATLCDALSVLMANAALRASLARTAFSIADGRGVDRVVRHLRRRGMELRLASPEDCDLLFEWRNHPDTRRYFFDALPLEIAAHRRWFAEALADRRRVQLIGITNGLEVGLVRFDLAEHEAQVSIYLDPARHGEGLGAQLLAAGTSWLKAHQPKVRTIVAQVLPGNEASLKAFLSAGFVETHRSLRLNIATAKNA